MEEKTRLINQVLELQHTLEGELTLDRCVKMTTFVYISFLRLPHSEKRSRLKDIKCCSLHKSSFLHVLTADLSARVDAVKEENLKLKSENQVLGQYIENLMSASSVFQTTDTRNKRSK